MLIVNFSLATVADLAWSNGEGHFCSKGRGWQTSLQSSWLAEHFPEFLYITEDSY